MSSQPIKLNDILRRAAALPMPLADGSASSEKVSLSYTVSIAKGYEILGQLEAFAQILRASTSQDTGTLFGMLIAPGGLENRLRGIEEAQDLLRSLESPIEVLSKVASIAPSSFRVLLQDLASRFSTAAADTRYYLNEESHRLTAYAPAGRERLFSARPSPMTDEETEAFHEDVFKRTSKILDALAE